ncbi:MAG TPA: phosphopantothenoylcysteine decarboxylase [Verrucomicrobiae bacterium]|nr:phosphopantothenoylcysteine decarboxylase [Verrucomicrobiae bacterium]
MNCIVTAGPTYEPLDDVRRLTNFSTGKLGAELANFLAARGHKVTLLIGETATYKGECRAQSVKTFSTTADLRAKLKSLSNNRGKKVDAIFHAAAVSDFMFGQIFVEKKFGEFVALKTSKKIPTRAGNLLVELLPTPKIIAELRGWFPKAKIVGWKFEADGKRADTIRAAQKQIADCATDFCVANGPAYGKGFNLVTPAGENHLATSQKLFVALEKFLRRTA